MRADYYYEGDALPAIDGRGVMCDGYKIEPCECCGKRCGHLEAITDARKLKVYEMPVEAIDVEYGHDSVQMCRGCALETLEAHKRIVEQITKELER